MDLGDRKAPLPQLAHGPPIAAVAGQVVQGVLVLGEHQQLHPGVAEDVVVRQDLAQLDQLGLHLPGLEGPGLVDETPELLDLHLEGLGIDVGHHLLQGGLDGGTLVVGELVVVVGQAPGDLLAAVALGVGQDLLALVPHALQAAAHGVDAGGEAALEHGHGEGQGSTADGAVLGGLDGLVLHVAGQRIIKVVLIAVQIEGGGADLALGEQLAYLAGFGIGEGDQGLLCAAQVEGGVVAAHGLFQALDVAVDVPVQQLQKKAEVRGVSLVWGGGHQQVMVATPGELLTKLVGQRLLVMAVGSHLVGLIHDDQVPVAAQQALLGVVDARHPGHGGDHLVTILPGVLPVVGA